jgi:hypothetical protein
MRQMWKRNRLLMRRWLLCLLAALCCLLAATATFAADEPSFKFPWDASQKLRFTGGPHIWTQGIHSGLDFSDGLTTTAILAMADGKVSFIGDENCKDGKCKTVKIAHDGGWETWYVHLSDYAPKLSEGDTVRQGQWIGNEGSSGAKFVHIHIELRKDSDPIGWQGQSLEGWMVHENCDGYDPKKNKEQPKLACASTDYNGYMSQSDVQMLPNQGAPQYSVESSNHARPAYHLSQVAQLDSFKPGQTTNLTLTLENIGPLAWPANGPVTLVNVNQQPLGPTTRPLTKAVPKGGQVAWVFPLTAPQQAGSYESDWKVAFNGEPFGEVIPITIMVVGGQDGSGWGDQISAMLRDAWQRLMNQIQATIEEAKRRAIERAKDEARQEAERQIRGICGTIPAGVVIAVGLAWWRVRKRGGQL